LAIDRIGNKGANVPTSTNESKSATFPKETASTFDAKRSAPASTTASAAPAATLAPSAALEGVRSGRLDVNGYVDAKVEQATSHLSHLSPSQLSTVRGIVRAQILSDPHLSELVTQATGQPLPKDEE
jgi:hypothetical protein